MKTNGESRILLKELVLENFKSFESAKLELGPFSLLLGTNASGKSNLREAFRFLHGIGRGYTLPEIIGEKWIEGGVRVWNGIRGGGYEIGFLNAEEFLLSVDIEAQNSTTFQITYTTIVDE